MLYEDKVIVDEEKRLVSLIEVQALEKFSPYTTV